MLRYFFSCLNLLLNLNLCENLLISTQIDHLNFFNLLQIFFLFYHGTAYLIRITRIWDIQILIFFLLIKRDILAMFKIHWFLGLGKRIIWTRYIKSDIIFFLFINYFIFFIYFFFHWVFNTFISYYFLYWFINIIIIYSFWFFQIIFGFNLFYDCIILV